MLSANQGTHRRGAAFIRLLAEATWRIAGETKKAHNALNEMGMPIIKASRNRDR